MITRLSFRMTSAKYTCLSRGVRAGLFSVRLWELPAWFDATVPPHLSGVRLWLSLPNFSASYHILCLPNVMPLIFILS